jgi:hypothetical protein
VKQQKPILHGRDHLSSGADPIPGFSQPPGGDTLDNVIAGFAPAGFWKLDESTGHIAHDSSGDGNDMTSAVTGGQDPSWGALAGPPGTPAANFQTGTGGIAGTAGREAINWPGGPIITAFTAGIFVSRNNTAQTYVMGQGNLPRAGGSGWLIEFENPSTGAGNRAVFSLSGVGSIEGANPILASTWVFLAGVYDGSLMKFYVNGLAEPITHTGTAAAAPSPYTLWIGQDGPGPSSGIAVSVPQFTGSYAFLVPTALSGAELLEAYNAAVFPGSSETGKALLATGTGGSSWDFPLEVTF